MAKKKGEIQLQREIETQEEWEEVMAMEGLWVVDVYQEWCGPCLALLGNFRRLKNELGDPLLNFAMAKADTIDALEKYRGRCEPTFLFFAGGILTSYIHGADAPKVQKVITEQLASEHKILEGTGERKEVKDPVITREQEKLIERLAEEEAMRIEEAAKYETKPIGVTVAIIKPDAVAQNKLDEIVAECEDDDDDMYTYFLDDPFVRTTLRGISVGRIGTRRKEYCEDDDDDMYTYFLDDPFVRTTLRGISVGRIGTRRKEYVSMHYVSCEIKANEITILAEQEKDITEEEAMVLYASLENEPHYDDLIRYIISGPSYIMLLTVGETGATIVKDWKEMLGPSNVEQAREEAPASLRARFGDKGFMNALHGSATKDAASKELALFFPNYQLPTFQQKKQNIQWTLAIIRPEVYVTKKNAILQKIMSAGFKIIMYKEVQLTKDQAAEFYKEHEQYAYFDSLVENMSSGPFLALTLSKDEAIKAWKNELGPSNIDDAIEKAPQSLRAQFQGTSGMNQIHGSDSEETAKEEIAYFFPMEQTVAVIKPQAMGVKDEIIAKIYEAGFKIAAQKETNIGPDLAEVLYTGQKNNPHYDDLINSIASGPGLFMVLSREGALAGWRIEMGDADPEVAKTTNPESLRAQFGTSLLHNAVHGSSNFLRAREEMRAIFGDLKFSEDGTVKGAQPDLDATALVIEHDRISDVGDDAQVYDESEPEIPGERTDTEQNVSPEHDTTDRKSQDGTDEDTHDATAENTQEPDGQEVDEQTDRARDDDVTDNNSTDHTQQVEQMENTEELQFETDVQEPNAEVTQMDTAEGSLTGADVPESNGGRKSRGSDHDSVNMEQQEQEAGYHGDAESDTNSKQKTVSEEEVPDIEQMSEVPEGEE